MDERTRVSEMEEEPNRETIEQAIRKIGRQTRKVWIELHPVLVTVERTSKAIEHDWWVVARQMERADIFAVLQIRSSSVKDVQLEDLQRLNPNLPPLREL